MAADTSALEPPHSTVVLDGKHTVLTPEYVEFHFQLAGLYSRFLAWLLDAAVVASAAGVIVGLVPAPPGFGGFAQAFAFVVYFLLDWGYGIALETLWSGQTVGKRALGIRVIQTSGVRITFTQALLRNLARPLDRLPLFYGVGGLAALLSRSQQRLGDLLAGTIVVKERRRAIPSELTRPAAELGSLDSPAFRTRVSRLSTEEAALLVSAALRREELGMEARLRLFAAIAERLQRELGFEKPEHLSDEKLVLLVTSAWVTSQRAR